VLGADVKIAGGEATRVPMHSETRRRAYGKVLQRLAWLWISKIEYTLPGDEHGTTWSLPWTYAVLEDSPARTALRMQVVEPTTGLQERIDLSVYPGEASFEADIRIANPGVDVWTYGFHPRDIPMGSGAPNKGYAEMWGGTVATFPHERRPLAPGESVAWRLAAAMDKPVEALSLRLMLALSPPDGLYPQTHLLDGQGVYTDIGGENRASAGFVLGRVEVQ
jgi:hypothetical protein